MFINPHNAGPGLSQEADQEPLTHSEAQIWLGQRLAGAAPLYNTPFTFRIRGPLDRDLFQRAFYQCIEDCDALRATFSDGPRGPSRLVRSASTVDAPLEWIDLSTHDDPVAEAEALLAQRARRPFDLSEGLFDSALVKLGPDDHLWFLNQHHLMTDAWATALLYRHLEACYRTLRSGQTTPPPPAHSTYRTHERAIRHQSDPEAEAWWNARAGTSPPDLYGRGNPDEATASTRVEIDLGPLRSDRLRTVCREPGVRALTTDLALFNVFNTVVFALLRRATGESTLSLGSPAHHRTSAAFRQTIGLFIEMFPLTVALEEDETFSRLLRRVQGESNGFIRHARPGLSEASVRTFNVVLNYLTVSFPSFDEQPVDVDWIHPGHCDHNHHLRIQVHDFRGTGTFSVIFDFNEVVFPVEQRKWVIAHFTHLLDAFLEDRDQAIDAVEVVHPDERALLLEGFQPPAAEAPGATICEAFERIVTARPDAPAVSDENNHLSYRELAERANTIAGRLQERGVESGSVVGLRASRDVETIAGLLGILRAGAAYLPVSPDHPATRTALALEEAGVQLVVGHGVLDGWDGPLLDPRETGNGLPAPEEGPQPSDLAYVLYTSGSTGRPKGVQIEHRNVLALVAGLRERIYAGEGDGLRVAMVAPFFFDPSVQQIFAALLLGHELVMVPEEVRIDGNALLHFFHERKIDLSDGTPQHLALLAKAAGADPADVRVRHLVIGGEELRPSTLRAFFERFPHGDPVVTNVYGPTECCVDSTSHRITRGDLDTLGETVPIGTPMPGERVHILAGNTLQPIGAPGELCIAGPAVGRGYQRSPEGTPAPFRQDPFLPGERLYRTGDLARYRRDGLLEFRGRRDTQVKVRGFRIELGEIEKALKSFEGPLPTAAVEPMAEISRPRRCVRCVLSEHYPGVSFDDEGLCNHCREFERYRPAATEYFRPFEELESLLAQSRDNGSEYDCLLLYSGGKDSSYVLHRLVEMGLKVLAFTFDNGFISPGAFRNIERQTSRLGVECIISKSSRMDAIFVESLDQDQTVCTGCFKALTTISTRLAADRGIRAVLTGLSRGQIYETKIEGLFRSGTTAVQQVEDKLRTFRRIYHSQHDRTSLLLDVAVDDVDLDRFHFLDFFRYDPTPTSEVKAYLAERDEFWSTPEDTGFCSSNCMMNDIGICVHSRERGYHNYEAPLSWDIRLGIAGREDALREVDSPVDVGRVNRVLGKIGFLNRRVDEAVVTVRTRSEGDATLCAYYTSAHDLDPGELRAHLATRLPDYMIPQHFVELAAIPLTPNGKIDYAALPDPGESAPGSEETAVSDNPTEARLVQIWQDVLQVGSVGVHDSFVSLGGTSLALIEMRIRLTSEFGVELPLPVLFSHPTVAQLAEAVTEARAAAEA